MPFDHSAFGKKEWTSATSFFSTKETPVKSGSLLMSLINRNYVNLLLQDAFFKTAKDVQKNIQVWNSFPYFDGFTLLPHWSHDDGGKLDITFLSKNKKTEQFYDKTFSIIGYGVCEEPRKGENATEWGRCLQDIKNREVENILHICSDGLSSWPKETV
ncbi:MAG: hypothetical protein ACJAT4_003181 [Granulosicoccus sp.]